jgi:hypothetical protein
MRNGCQRAAAIAIGSPPDTTVSRSHAPVSGELPGGRPTLLLLDLACFRKRAQRAQ